MSLISFAIVLGVGFWKQGCTFSRCSCPRTAADFQGPSSLSIEFVSFLVRPFSLGLRPFIAMFAGHILLDVFGNFVVQALQQP